MTASVLAVPSISPIPPPASITYGHWWLSDRSVSLPASRKKPDGADRAAHDHGGPGAAAVEDPPPDLGEDHEAEEEVQEVERRRWRPSLPSDTCAYTLAKKKNGTNDDRHQPEHRGVGRRSRGRGRSAAAAAGRACAAPSARTRPCSSAPTTMQPQVAALLQPHTADCCKPEHDAAPIAPVISTVPR